MCAKKFARVLHMHETRAYFAFRACSLRVCASFAPHLHLATRSFALALSCMCEFSDGTAVRGTGPITQYGSTVYIGIAVGGLAL